jgi:hypothetical protein
LETNAANARPNQPILITGCQRSGTTLLHLVLDSHPDVHGVDETAYTNRLLPRFLEHPDFHPRVAFKLPTFAHAVDTFHLLPGLRILWCLRDPRAVVSSMLELQLRLGELFQAAWAVHPAGAEWEIAASLGALGGAAPPELADAVEQHGRMRRLPVSERTRAQAVASAALCWRLKNELLARYDEAGHAYRVVRYEALVSAPEATVRDVLAFLELPWHDDVLAHHALHRGVSVGNTVNSRPIDTASVERWQGRLQEDDLAQVRVVCGELADSLGYRL